MSVTINCKQYEAGFATVNGKRLVRDLEGNWIAQDEFTPEEAQYFQEFRRTLEKFKQETGEIMYKI